MARFFLSPDQISGEKVEFNGEDVNHIIKALRLKIGAEVYVLDGTGFQYLVQLEEISKHKVTGQIIGKSKPQREASYQVYLIQGLPKGDKMDLILQKSTELGIKGIIPVNTERSVVKLDNKKVEQRRERWQKIAKEAAEQSGRTIVPEVSKVEDLNVVLGSIQGQGLILMPWEEEKSQGLKPLLEKRKNDLKETNQAIYLIIGPEGGFSEQEVEKAKAVGALPLSLGPRILRTETAGLAALTMVLYELGDLGG